MRKVLVTQSVELSRRWFIVLLAGLPALGAQEADRRFASHVEPASEEAAQAMQLFELAPAMQVELFAAEPRLANPVSFCFDRRGDVYVAETFRHHAGVTDMRDHMAWLDDDVSARTVADRVAMFRRHEGERFADYSRAEERIRLIRDSDGDGVADLDIVFAGGFDEPGAGIGAGLLAWKGSLYYTCIPHLWRLRDRDGNLRADERVALQSGYGVHVALLGHDLHGLAIGPEGRLYFSCGDRGLSIETPQGTIRNTHSGAVLRCELDGTGLEIFASGLRNPQELAFDVRGDLFTGDNNSDGGDRARWVHVVEGSDAGWRYAYQYLEEPELRGPWNDEGLWKPHFPGQAAYIVPPIANLADGPSGLVHYPGTGLGPEYDGHFFLCDFRGDARRSGVHTFAVEPRGASFTLGEVKPFVWGVLATDCDFGPDGALYVSDWVQGWNKTGKGRLYRVFDPEQRASESVLETRRLLAEGMAERSPAELAALCGHADRRVRQDAHLELAERGEEGHAALSGLASSGSGLARLHGVWGLWARARVGGSRSELLALLGDADAEMRAQAARALGDLREPGAGARFVARLADESARVRLHAALGLWKLELPDAAGPLITLAREIGEDDPTLRHAAALALSTCASAEALAALAADPAIDVRVAAVVALRRRADPALERFLGDAEPRVAVEAARAIYDVPVPGALAALADQLEPLRAHRKAWARRALAAAYRLGGEERARSLARLAADGEAPESLRVEALRLLAQWAAPPGRDPLLGDWRPIEPRDASFLPALSAELAANVSERGAASAPPAVAVAWIELAASCGAREQAPALRECALDRARPTAVRTAALRALGELRTEGLVETLRGVALDPQRKVRAQALSLLQEVAPAEVLPLYEAALLLGSKEERRAAYAGLAKLDEPRAEDLLALELERLAAQLVPAELALDLVEAIEARRSDALSARLEILHAPRAADPVLAPWLDSLSGGDAERGRSLYTSKSELACLRCHPAAETVGTNGDRGATVGPDLAGVGGRLTRLELVESIVAPNRRIADGYPGTVFFLTAGSPVEGRVVGEDEREVRVCKADGAIVAIEKSEIELVREGLSAMPDGIAEHLTRQEMRDLIEYLSQL
ncbi:MAG TPA: PVC-type heme-binding CxxCH protein [Planctomycetota bacterium]|nr:PVC-type heme-binding CxxCH protein [Planctomycetota bacterium]